MSDAKREAEAIFFAAGAAQRLPVLDHLIGRRRCGA